MIVSAIFVIKQMKTIEEYGLLDNPNNRSDIIWWLLLQYLLTGVVDVFMMVGLQEFFYDQVLTELKIINLVLYIVNSASVDF